MNNKKILKQTNKTINKSIIKTLTYSVLIITTLFITLFLSQTTTAAPCTAGTTSLCGATINTPGQGAVELCDDCFACGLADGVCPMWYSVGDTETREIPIRITKPRPNETSTEFIDMYVSGAEACDVVSGTYIETSARDEYDVAICENAPKTASCNNCPDPDCVTELRGLAYTKNDEGELQPIQNARIMIYSENHPNPETLMKLNETNEKGEFEILNAYVGRLNMTCLANDYEPITKTITLVPGKNIIDCEMASAICRDDCTVPSATGGRMCAARCHGVNGCGFNTTEIMNACNQRPLNLFYVFNSEIIDIFSVNLTGAVCCEGAMETRTVPRFNPGGDNIRNLITRKYNKILDDGTPVALNIIVYNK